jgi:hypothetical protein
MSSMCAYTRYLVLRRRFKNPETSHMLTNPDLQVISTTTYKLYQPPTQQTMKRHSKIRSF